jgi:tetratricopeptide (TPR) repeat protein
MMRRLALAALAAASIAGPAASQEVDLDQLLSQAVTRHRAGDLEAAAVLYERILREAPNAALVRSNLGAVYARLGRNDDAIAQYRQALALEDNAAIRYNLAIALQRAGRISEAMAEGERVVAAQPGNRDAILLLADCHSQMGEFEKVADLLRPLAAQHPEDKAVAHLLGTALLELGRTADAEAVLNPLFRENTPETHVLLATLHAKRKDWAKAGEEAELALKANPALPLANFLHGLSLMNDASDWAGAEAAFRKELDVDPNHFETNLLLGNLLRTKGSYEEALRFIQRAAKLRADDPDVKYSLGTVYVSLGRMEDARPLLEAVVAAFPDHIQSHTQLAILFARLGLVAESQRERAIVAKLQKAAETNGFQNVRESLSGVLGQPAPTK